VGAWLGAHPLLLVLLACGLDRWIGDPASCLHPVQVMGWAIAQLRRLAETSAGDSPMRLRLAGGVITALVVGASAAVGWALERLLLASLAPINAGVPASAWLGGGALVAMVLALVLMPVLGGKGEGGDGGNLAITIVTTLLENNPNR